MKTLGLIGGMSWESTSEYYRLLNEGIQGKLGKHHSAKLLLYSVDFEELVAMTHQEQIWEKAGRFISAIAKNLERGGAKALLICANTMHKVAEQVAREVQIPIIHIIETTAKAVEKKGFKKVGLLGTIITMEDGFYQACMDKHQIEIITPKKKDREWIQQSIFQELCLGKINEATRKEYVRIIQDLVQSGAEGVILGCTEIPLIVGAKDSPVPVLNTTKLHAEAAVAFALG